jgi:dTDP-4-dehydrorhamnose 3,5-epimerase
MNALERWNDVVLIEPEVFHDDRGWFMESYSLSKMKELGVDAVFVQDNHSFSIGKGVVRGIHFQNEPKAQSKLVHCTRGSVLDVVVDLRKGSPYHLRWRSFVLSCKNKRMVFIPKGFGHGFLSLEDLTEVQYKVDVPYDKASERTIRFDDPSIGIEWGVDMPILSEKDLKGSTAELSNCNFIYRG